MEQTNWSAALSVNVGSIDHEHEAIFGMISELNEAISSHSSRDVLGGILSRLTSYSIGHFGHEEKIMQRLQYAGYAQHKAEHDEFISQISGYRQAFNHGELQLTPDFIDFLCGWLSNHIQVTDMQYVEVLGNHGYH